MRYVPANTCFLTARTYCGLLLSTGVQLIYSMETYRSLLLWLLSPPVRCQLKIRLVFDDIHLAVPEMNERNEDSWDAGRARHFSTATRALFDEVYLLTGILGSMLRRCIGE